MVVNENTKITVRNAVLVIGFVVSIVSGYFYTLDTINDSVSAVDARVTAVKADAAAVEARVTNLETARIEDKERLIRIEANLFKLMVASGVEPATPEK